MTKGEKLVSQVLSKLYEYGGFDMFWDTLPEKYAKDLKEELAALFDAEIYFADGEKNSGQPVTSPNLRSG